MDRVNLLTALFEVFADLLAGPYMLGTVIVLLGAITIVPELIAVGVAIIFGVVLVAVLFAPPENA